MLSEKQVREIALFFLFSLPNEQLALASTEHVIAKAKAKDVDASISHDHFLNLVLPLCVSEWKYAFRHLPKDKTTWTFSNHMKVAVDLSSWLKFLKSTSENEILAVALKVRFELDDRRLGELLKVTEGTAQYRLGKAYRTLGLDVLAKSI